VSIDLSIWKRYASESLIKFRRVSFSETEEIQKKIGRNKIEEFQEISSLEPSFLIS